MRASDIQHPAFRIALETFHQSQPLDISTLADLPAQTGLGSSGSFMVGLIMMLDALKGGAMPPLELAQTAIKLEHDKLKHLCGVQDQLHAAFGGINYFDLSYGAINRHPITLSPEKLDILRQSMVLVFTGATRHAQEVLQEQVDATRQGTLDTELHKCFETAQQGRVILENNTGDDFIKEFGLLMHEGWQSKRRFAARITTPDIDALYEHGLAQGAYGGKLCGAGAGGFMLFIVPPERRKHFIDSFPKDRVVDFGFDMQGATILHNVSDPTDSPISRGVELINPAAYTSDPMN